MPFEFLKVKHPIWEANIELWERNERRLHGGDEVLDELRRFDWELEDGEDFKSRQNQATYINFAELYATMMIGHLLRKQPVADEALSFGAMGLVRRAAGQLFPSQSELVYYNTDGIGNDGSQWDTFWSDAVKHAMATGHRWIYVDAPRVAPQNGQDEINGLRPYLADISPRLVTNFDMVRGQLNMAVITTSTRKLVVGADGAVTGNEEVPQYLLLTRAGYDAFDAYSPLFGVGGWFLFDDKTEMIDAGAWDKTFGEIPLFPLYYQRALSSPTKPRMSRPGITELGNVAVSYMNLTSAADFDAWDAAKSLEWLRGVDIEGYNLAMAKLTAGSRYVPLTLHRDKAVVPEVTDSGVGAIVAEVFQVRLDAKVKEARLLAAMEATGTPDASGVSKNVGFIESKSPRLALIASELESCQRIAIHFLELRFGWAKPSGNVTWTRDFDLTEVRERVSEFFKIQQASGLFSPTLTTAAMIAAARDSKLITDDDTQAIIVAEYTKAAAEKVVSDAQQQDLVRQFGG